MPPAQPALVQPADRSFQGHRHDDVGRPGGVRHAAEHAGALVQAQPRRAPGEYEPRLLDVPEARRSPCRPRCGGAGRPASGSSPPGLGTRRRPGPSRRVGRTGTAGERPRSRKARSASPCRRSPPPGSTLCWRWAASRPRPGRPARCFRSRRRNWPAPRGHVLRSTHVDHVRLVADREALLIAAVDAVLDRLSPRAAGVPAQHRADPRSPGRLPGEPPSAAPDRRA